MTFCAPTQGIFAGLTQAQLQAYLASAQDAYMKLSTGAQIASAGYSQGDGAKNVSYRQADIGQLTALILQIQQALGMGRARRPIRYTFR